MVVLSNQVEVSAVYQLVDKLPSPGFIFLSMDFGFVLSHAGQIFARAVS
jgi:hypothetical protein